MESAYWVDWQEGTSTPMPPGRVYFGHETCERLLPSPHAASELAKKARANGRPLTLVTPLLTNFGMDQAQRLIDTLLDLFGDLEVVCSDWGMLDLLASRQTGTPIVGRLLAAQSTDPRIMRIMSPPASATARRRVRHLDGTLCELQYDPPSPDLALHYRSCWLDKPSVLAFLMGCGVHRAEISNPGQGVELIRRPGWSYSLHVPDVLVAVMRNCPAGGEDFDHAAPCRSGGCGLTEITWRLDGLSVDVIRRGNGLYYRWPQLPPNLALLPIDRIVYRSPS